MIHYLGIDGGGTKTRFLLYDSEGTIKDTLVLDSIHFMSTTEQEITDTLNKAKKHYEDRGYFPETFKILIGLGGYGSDAAIRQKIKAAVHLALPQSVLINDAQLAMISALQNQDGIFIISGTGSIALYQNGDKQERSGGFGYLIGDEGSAFWIGKKILEHYAKENDGREPKSNITTFINQHFQLNQPADLIRIVSEQKSNYRNFVAQIAGAISQTNDEALTTIYTQAGIELAQHANAFKINKRTPVAIGGSVLMNNTIVRQSMIDHLDDHLYYQENNNEPEHAAVVYFKTEES